MMNRRDLLKGSALALAATAAAASPVKEPASPKRQTSLTWAPVFPGIWKATIGVPEKYTPISGRTIPPAEGALRRLPAPQEASIKLLGAKVGPLGCLITLPLAPNENIFGFGLQLLSFAQRGKKKTIRVNADPKVDTGDSHAPVPFYVSTIGYGIFVDSCRRVSFNCDNARLRPTKPISTTSNEVATPDSVRTLPLEASGVVTVDVPRAMGVDVYLFAGPTMMDVVRRYNLFSGGGVEPPEWGLGFWYRAYTRDNASEIVELARELRERKIPCDVLGLEPGWQSHAYSCSFAWHASRFSDPKGFLAELQSLGYQVNLWEHAFTHPSSPLFEDLLPHSADYGVWGGLVPDFVDDAGRKVFGDYHGKNLIDAGISGFKLDECDNSDFTGGGGWSFQDFTQFPSGLDGEQMHHVFGLRYQDAILDQFKKRNKSTFGLVRSSGALASPYPFVLYSDLYDHRDFVRALVNSGFSGLLWCPEVRDANSELDLVRRLQTVVFSPLAMVNAWYIKNPPWKQIDQERNNEDQLSENWQALEARCRNIIEWRMRLVPYLRSAFARYALDGTPPFRALVLDYPNDLRLHGIDSEYMMGDRMLVAPLFAGEDAREVVLPEGVWHDFWTGQVFNGGRSYQIPGFQEDIPVFVKAGSILPFGGVALTTTSNATRDLTVAVYGDGSLTWKLDGDAGLELRRSSSNGVDVRAVGSKPHGYRIVAVQHMEG
ncbi:MAG TPA: TIM-barrel domain-containing protein [Terriglobales bacterium]|nr:TIM-barrel domain-containing protein [Terriglobales bacterium]